jgi:hypothetical protein
VSSGAHSLSPAEQQAMLQAERRGEAFLAFRDGAGDLRLLGLGEHGRLRIGRAAGNDVVLGWDGQVSRSHAQLDGAGTEWAVVDDGLSRNGTLVNGERVVGRRRLRDGDVVRIGATTIVFRAPAGDPVSTLVEPSLPHVRLSDAERRVLVALCLPFLDHREPASVPASNREIADALHLSAESVKSHVRSLFEKLGIGDLPQYHKRTALAQRALERGLVTRSDAPR